MYLTLKALKLTEMTKLFVYLTIFLKPSGTEYFNFIGPLLESNSLRITPGST